MKVGVYLHNIAPTAGGGYTFQDDIYHSLLKLYPESRHEFSVITHQPDGLHAWWIHNEAGKRLYPVAVGEKAVRKLHHHFRRVPYTPADSARLNQAVQDLRLGFVWFAGANFIPVDAPYLATVWDLQHRLQPWFPEVSAGREWEQRERLLAQMLPRAAGIIAGTQAGKAEIMQFYQIPAERVLLLPHPTPHFALNVPANTDGSVLQKYQLPPNYLFYPAQFWAHKNHVGLLHVLRCLRDFYQTRLPLVLVGSPKGNQEYIQRLIRELGLSDQVFILGFVSREELVALYRQALALVYLTFFGPENLPPLEAFALGCPVIASRVSGAEEQLGDAALLVSPTDDDAVAQAVLSLMQSDTLRSTLIERGKARALRWTGVEYVRGVFKFLDEFELIRRAWA